MAKTKPQAAYVVFRGKIPGIYYSLAECQAQVKGFSGAKHKGYDSLTEAQRAWNKNQVSTFLPEEQVRSTRKRSCSDGTDGVGDGAPSGGRIRKVQRTEIPDSEDEDISSGDEVWQAAGLPELPSSTNQVNDEILDFTAEAEEPEGEMSFVARMMSKFGYQEGQGLAKDGQGRTTPIDVTVRPKGVGLGFTEENTATEPKVPKPLDLRGEPEISLTAAQQAVVTMAENGDNIFLTGAAGSGKTLTLKEILRRLQAKHKTKNKKFPAVQVTAPTGIAALPLEGKTTWSFAGWTPNSFHQTSKDLVTDVKTQVIRTMKDVRVLIIDEISMVENHFLERLNMFMQSVLKSPLPFAGKQVIFVGDFHQIPPVKPFQCCLKCGEPMVAKLDGPLCTTPRCTYSHDQVALKWGDKWAFKAPVWKKLNLKHVKLEQIHRQKDTGFQATLNKIRNGISLPDEEWKALESRKILPRGVAAIRLMSRVAQVRSFNNDRLDAITKAPKFWKAVDVCRKAFTTDADRADTARVTKKKGEYLETLKDHSFQTDLTLKVGAKVLLLYNLAPEHSLVNGAQGEVIGFVDTSAWEIKVPEGDNKEYREERVREFRDLNPWRPIVRFANGYQCTIEPIAAESFRGRSDDRYLVCRTQIPLTLGWALSIHKSQGMTLDYVELSSRDIFESGQLYVGLSRATRLDGLTVTGFNRRVLEVDREVLEFYRDAEWVDLGQDNRSL